MAERPCDHYQLLGVARTASAAEVTRAYRRRLRSCHPDLVGATLQHGADAALSDAAARARALNDAHAVLRDPATRARYDATLPLPVAPSLPRACDITLHVPAPVTERYCGPVVVQERPPVAPVIRTWEAYTGATRCESLGRLVDMVL